MDQGQIFIPDVGIGMGKVKALCIAGHVGGSGDGERLAVEFEIIRVYGEARARTQKFFIANPECGMINRADLVSFQEFSFDDVESFGGGRG